METFLWQGVENEGFVFRWKHIGSGLQLHNNPSFLVVSLFQSAHIYPQKTQQTPPGETKPQSPPSAYLHTRNFHGDFDLFPPPGSSVFFFCDSGFSSSSVSSSRLFAKTSF